jgi:hypothetical protein
MAKPPVKKIEPSNPHESEEGYTASRQNKITGAWNVLYKNEQNDLETGRWSVLCVYHGYLVVVKLKRKATSMLLRPAEWCSACKNDKDIEEAKKIFEIQSSHDRPQTDQIRMLAKLAKGNPAKCLMFEEIHGEKPDQFWD